MAGNGSADDFRGNSEGVDALAQMLYSRGGQRVPGRIPAEKSHSSQVPPTASSELDIDIDALLGSLRGEFAETPARGELGRSTPGMADRSTAGNVPFGRQAPALRPDLGAAPAKLPPTVVSSPKSAQNVAELPQAEDRQLLAKASEIADGLQTRFGELERREQKLSELLSSFEQEQRRFRMTQQEQLDEVASRTAQLAGREQELSNRLSQGQSLLTELQRREQEVDQARHELDAERERLQQAAERELEVERSSLKHAKNLIEAERQDLNARMDRQREEHQEALRQARRELEVERRRLRSQLGSDIDAEREQLKRERDEWQRIRAEQEAILQRERDAQTTALQRVERQLADEQKRQNEVYESRRRELEQQFAESRANLDQERRQWDVQRATADEEIGRQKFLNVETLRKIEDEKSSREQALLATLQRLKEEHNRGMQSERQAFDAELQKRREQFAVELERHRQKFQEEANQHRERLAEERRRFDEALRVEQERATAERSRLQAEFDQRSTDWAKRRDQEADALASDRQEIERAAIAAEADLAARKTQLEDDARRARDASLNELRSNWDVERQELRRQLATDIETERKRLNDEQQAFEARQMREHETLSRTKEAQESAIKQARSELIRDKQALLDELRRERAVHDEQLTALRGQFEVGLQQQFAATEQRIAQELDALQLQKQNHQAAISEASEQLAEERKQLAATREALIAEHRRNAEELATWQRNLESQEHQQTVLGQQWRLRVAQTEEQFRMRRTQLDRYRELLAEREQSLAREEELVARWQQEFDVEQQHDRERMAAQRGMLERQHQELMQEQQQAEARVARELEKLKDRNTRLEGLRKELEQTSLRNLEDRLAAEEALADLISQTGEVEARQRVQEVRTVIAGQIREMQNAAKSTQSDETARMVAFTQQQLEEETTRLKRDRENFLRRMSEREHELHEQETLLETKNREWQQRESKLRQTRDSWLKERLNAEQIIRGLLDELSAEVV